MYRFWILFCAVILGYSPIASANLFTFSATVDGVHQEGTYNFSNAEEAIRAAENGQFDHLFPAYTETSVATVAINFRGLDVNVSYPNSGTSVVFEIPSLGIVETFSGATRDDSIDDMVNFIEGEGGNITNRIQHALVRASAVDAVAGNPTSIQSVLAAEAFKAGAFNNTMRRISKKKERRDNKNSFSIDPELSSLKAGNYDGTFYSFPLAYTINLDDDPGVAINLRLPITYTKVEGASTYSVGAGIDVNIPVGAHWDITPSVWYGATGSEDLASGAQMVGTSVTSRYTQEMDGYNIIIGNMAGIVKSLGLSVGNYEVDPEIENGVFKNGLLFDVPIETNMWDESSIETSFIHTYFTGTDLFLNSYQEVGLTFGGLNVDGKNYKTEARFGLKYTFGNDYDSLGLNVNYSF